MDRRRSRESIPGLIDRVEQWEGGRELRKEEGRTTNRRAATDRRRGSGIEEVMPSPRSGALAREQHPSVPTESTTTTTTVALQGGGGLRRRRRSGHTIEQAEGWLHKKAKR